MSITYSFDQAFELADFWMGVRYDDGTHRIVIDPTGGPHDDGGVIFIDGVKHTRPLTEIEDWLTDVKEWLSLRRIRIDTGWVPDGPVYVSPEGSRNIIDCRTGETL